MSNGDRCTDTRPLGEQIGTTLILKAERRVGIISDILTILGLFVSWGSGLEGIVALCGIALKYTPLPKRFVRWIGEQGLESPEPRPRRFFNK